jgi:hypothetical protein
VRQDTDRGGGHAPTTPNPARPGAGPLNRRERIPLQLCLSRGSEPARTSSMLCQGWVRKTVERATDMQRPRRFLEHSHSPAFKTPPYLPTSLWYDGHVGAVSTHGTCRTRRGCAPGAPSCRTGRRLSGRRWPCSGTRRSSRARPRSPTRPRRGTRRPCARTRRRPRWSGSWMRSLARG